MLKLYTKNSMSTSRAVDNLIVSFRHFSEKKIVFSFIPSRANIFLWNWKLPPPRGKF
jgi:hypothetical protein